MSFLAGLPCSNPESFTELENKKSPDKSRTPTAHNVPITDDEKTIQPEKVPYFMRVLDKNIKETTGEALLPDEIKTRKKRKYEESEDQPSSSKRPQ